MLDDLLDGAHFEVVFFDEVGELGESGHGAVGVADLDPDGRGGEPGEFAEVDGALGLSDSDEDAAVAGAERVDVSGPDEVVAGGSGVEGEFDRFGAFLSGDAGGEAVLGVAVDGDGQRRAADGGIDGGLGVEVEPVAVGLGEGEEEVAPGLSDHECDGLGCDELGSHDEVALVLAVFIVGEDDDPACSELVEDLFDGAERGSIHRRW